MKKLLPSLLLALICLASCSETDPEEPVVPGPEEFELESKIIGKWDVTQASEKEQLSSAKSTQTGCYIFSIVFRADNSFRINSRQGIIEGTYEVVSEEKIILNNQGSLGEIEFISGGISFTIALDGLCSAKLNCLYDPDFTSGECSSFLSCNDQQLWKLEENQQTTFIRFFDHHDGTWYRKFSFPAAQRCYSVESNQLETGTMNLFKNNINELQYVYDSGELTEVYTYSKAGNGDLLLQVEAESGNRELVFKPTTQAALEERLQLPECGAKTFVPDDGFEKYLLDMGYDHVLDDYVLTENIFYLESVDIEDYYYRDLKALTGLEDFKNLRFLQIIGSHSPDLKSLDLTGNEKLERIYLEISALESIDLSQNPLLNLVFIQDAKIESFDFSNNPLLKGFEFNGGKVKTLDISKNKNLQNFQLENNPLETIILGDNPELTEMRINGHSGEKGNLPRMPLKEIDVSGAPKLKLMHIKYASVEGVDLSKNPELFDLNLSDNYLQELDISQNEKLQEFNASENPELSCIEVSAANLSEISEFPLSWTKDDAAEFSLDCGS